MSYIEREALLSAAKGYDWIAGLKTVMKRIPAADVRPVVLCRDCKHRDPEDHKCDCGQLERAGCVFRVDDDYYCAYGVKREESRAEMRNRRIGND